MDTIQNIDRGQSRPAKRRAAIAAAMAATAVLVPIAGHAEEGGVPTLQGALEDLRAGGFLIGNHDIAGARTVAMGTVKAAYAVAAESLSVEEEGSTAVVPAPATDAGTLKAG